MNTPEIKCGECGDMISINIARIDESCEFETNPEEFRYLCPVCAIQAKNKTMQAKMLHGLNIKN